MKFRVWSPYQEKFFRDQFALTCNGSLIVNLETNRYGCVGGDCIVQFYTDCRDKDNREIYEGDIIEWIDEFEYICSGGKDKSKYLFKVAFESGSFWLVPLKDPPEDPISLFAASADENTGMCHLLVEVDACEIKGNIFENADLLK